MSIKVKLGALVHDLPRFARAMRRPDGWIALRNRNERLTLDGRGARCEWEYTSELHVANVFPRAGARLMERAFRDWPIDLGGAAGHRVILSRVDGEGPSSVQQGRSFAVYAAQDDTVARRSRGTAEVSFVIGHRGMARLPHLLATLRSIAGQRGVAVECVVVEQSERPEIAAHLPPWVRYLHTPTRERDDPYNRSWTLNAGARMAEGEVLILHDNDMLCPAGYAAEALARAREGWAFQQLKRFTFYLGEHDSAALFAGGPLRTDVPSTVVQNLHGASIAASREAYFEIGGFDESFLGWGGEDNEFWDRAETTGRVYAFGYLPFIHLWHAPQPGKQLGNDAPAVRRWHELKHVPAEERIRRLRERA